MRVAPIILWTGQALPASGVVTSKAIPINQAYGYAVQVYWTGSPVGNFSLNGSCDPGQIDPDGTIVGVTNWTTITGSSTAAGGMAGTILYNAPDVMYLWFQLVYTATSGTGTATATCSVKGV